MGPSDFERSLLVAVLVCGACASSPRQRTPDEPVGAPGETKRADPADMPGASGPDSSESERDESDGTRSATTEPDLRGVFPEERVNLDFRNTSVRRVLRIFREKAGVQIVVGSEVRGRVTVRVEDAPVRDAFRAVLETARLECVRRGEALLIRPRAPENGTASD